MPFNNPIKKFTETSEKTAILSGVALGIAFLALVIAVSALKKSAD